MTGAADAVFDGAFGMITGAVERITHIEAHQYLIQWHVCAGNQMECPDCLTEQYTRNCACI